MTHDHAPTEPLDDRSPASRPRHPVRTLAITSSLAVALIAVGAAALGGYVPGAPLLAGPLEGGTGVDIKLPLHPGDTGALWGVLELENRSGSPIVLDSVEVAEDPQHVKLLTDPYIWDDSRVSILGFGSVSAYQIPLPATWKLPPQHQVRGFTIRPDSGRADRSEESPYDGASPEIMFEFAPPAHASEVSGITVSYHIGWYAYRRTFDLSLTMCPPDDSGPCEQAS